MFPPPAAVNGGSPDYRAAKALCASCPVVRQCHEDDMETIDTYDAHGMRAGLTPRKRLEVSRRRRLV